MPHHRRTFGLTIAFIAIAAWVRLWALGPSPMWADQSIVMGMSQAWLNGGELPLVSMKSSFGVFNPPFVQYLVALPLWLYPDPMAVLVWTALVNLIGAFVLGLSVGRLFGWLAGLICAALFVVNPWAVTFGSLIWMQSFVPALAACALAALFWAADRPDSVWARLLIGPSVAALVQVHLSSIVLVPIIAAWGLWAIRWRTWPVWAGLGLGALSFAPMLVFEIRNGWPDLAALQTGLTGTSEANAAAFLLTLDLFQSSSVYFGPLGADPYRWRDLDAGSPLIDFLSVGLLASALVTVIATTLRRGRQAVSSASAAEKTLFLAVGWLLLPPVFFFRHSHYLQPYYFLFALPAGFVLVTWVSQAFAERLRARLGRWVWVAYLPVALVIGGQLRTSLLGQQVALQGPGSSPRVMDFSQMLNDARALVEMHPDCPLVVTGESGRWDETAFGFVREFLAPTSVRLAAAGREHIVPSPCAIYLVVRPEPATLAWLRAQRANELPERAIAAPGGTWRFFTQTTQAFTDLERELTQLATVDTRWANGLVLRDLVLPSGPVPTGGALEVQAIWQVRAPVDSRPGLQMGVFLLDDTGALREQRDGSFGDSGSWRNHDWLHTLTLLPIPTDLPSGTYRLAIVFYTLPDLTRIPLAGQTADLWLGPAVQVGP